MFTVFVLTFALFRQLMYFHQSCSRSPTDKFNLLVFDQPKNKFYFGKPLISALD